jgi:hypothetical protein
LLDAQLTAAFLQKVAREWGGWALWLGKPSLKTAVGRFDELLLLSGQLKRGHYISSITTNEHVSCFFDFLQLAGMDDASRRSEL